MKPKELNEFIESLVYREVKNNILFETEFKKKNVYHIKVDGQPIDTFDSMEEAKEVLNKLKKDHPGKQFIIEKSVYESESDMIDKLDKMGEKLEEKENINMKKTPVKVKSLAEAILHGKENNIKKIKVNGESYDINEVWKSMEEEETCNECGAMEEDMSLYELMDLPNSEDEDYGDDFEKLDDEEETEEKPELPAKFKGLDLGKSFDKFKKSEDLSEGEGVCNECGGQMSEGVCNECGYLKESKKKVLVLKESEFIKVIENIVKESKNDPFSKPSPKGQTGKETSPATVKGLTVTKKAQSGSGQEAKSYASEVGKKMKDYLSFDGNDNPEFPKPIGKGEKMVVKTNDEENEFIEDYRGEGMQNLRYDHEPTERFKDRLKKSLEGDSTMGNSQDSPNVIKSDLGKKMVKQIKRSEEKREEQPYYRKDGDPVRPFKVKKDYVGVNESEESKSSVLNEEIERIKNFYSYNKKTQ